MCQFAKDLKTGIDFFPGEGLQAFNAKTLHRKRSHHTTIKESPLQHLAIQLLLRGDVSHESARERITRSGWIFDFLDRQRGCAKRMAADAECAFAKEYGRTVFAMLDDQSLRSHGKDFLGGPEQIRFPSEHFGFGVVDQ